MIGKLVAAECLKIKRKGFWFLTCLGPFGVVALQMVNYGVRKDYLLQQSDHDWVYYLSNVNVFTPLALVLGIAILTSLMTSIENETSAWKQWLALPVSKCTVYVSKFAVLLLLLLVSSFLLMVFTLAYGFFLNFNENIPYVQLFQYSFFPYFAAWPILALQLWIATVSHNQGLPMTIAVLGVILTYSAYFLPDWMIWKWPSLMNEWDEPILYVLLGIGVGCLLYMAGMIDFARRDVK